MDYISLSDSYISNVIQDSFNLSLAIKTSKDKESSSYYKRKLAVDINRLNFFIGENNSGKSKFLRAMFISSIVAWRDDRGVHFCSENNHNDIFLEKYGSKTVIVDCIYIPVLRGLRPVYNSIEKDCHLVRTINDYFKENRFDENNGVLVKNLTDYGREKETCKRIITSEKFEHVRKHGETATNRKKVEKYTSKLSEYFFGDRKVEIFTPSDSDVIRISIEGDDKVKKDNLDDDSIDIYDVGDGIQQILLLTYQAFMNDEKEEIFFIEEPEINLHPRMLKQLMSFYLNETKHYYFFTTHSNHLLDMKEECDDVMIYKFKKLKENEIDKDKRFKVTKLGSKDSELLLDLGVKPSSVYLANCAILVEGITDRLYIEELLKIYIAKYNKKAYRKDFHYAYLEYSGGNLAHWGFQDDDSNEKQNTLSISNNVFVICDGDVRNKQKRCEVLQKELRENIYFLQSKEIENILPKEEFLNFYSEYILKKVNDSDKTDIRNCLSHVELTSPYGLGKLFKEQIEKSGLDMAKYKNISDESGTLANKVSICKGFVDCLRNDNRYSEFELTDEAEELCEKLYNFIESMQ